MAEKLTFVNDAVRQPSSAYKRLNPSHFLFKNLIDVIDGSVYPPQSLILRTRATAFGTVPVRQPTANGLGIDTNAGFGGWKFQRTDNKYTPGGNLGVFMVTRAASASGNYAGLFCTAYNNGTTTGIAFSSMTSGNMSFYVATTSVSLGTTASIFTNKQITIAINEISGVGAELYLDGAFNTSATIAQATVNQANSSLILFGERTASATYSVKGNCSLFYLFNRPLTPSEIKSLNDNPWQIFEPEIIPLFKPEGTGPITHPTSGDVVGNTATVTGSALRETGVQEHPSTGDVVGNTATVSGTALRYRAHETTGVVSGLTSNVTGTALRYRLHTTTGAATGMTSTVTGSATIQPAPGIHVSTGDVVAGTGSVSGTALHIGVHPTTGVLSGFSAEVIGAAQRSGAVIVHSTSGVLAGYDSVVTGAATNQGSMTLTPADIQAIVAAIKAEIMPVNIVRVNNIDVDGTGVAGDEWGPV